MFAPLKAATQHYPFSENKCLVAVALLAKESTLLLWQVNFCCIPSCLAALSANISVWDFRQQTAPLTHAYDIRTSVSPRDIIFVCCLYWAIEIR